MKNENTLTPEQYAIYEGIVNEIEKYRGLSPEEKEALILDIVSRPYIDLLCDWAFKHVFGHHPELLILLLNDILPENINSLTYLPNESDRWKGDDKVVIMDVLCETAGGKKIIVEMQQQDRAWLKNRMMYYGASMLSGQLSAGDSYGSLKSVYVVCLMDFKLKHDDDRLIYAYQMRERESHELYGELLSIYLCELPRLTETTLSKMNPVEAWFHILKNSATFTEIPEDLDPRLKPVMEAARSKKLSGEDRIQYFRAMVSEEDKRDIAQAYLERGIEQGLEQGKIEERLDIARRMLSLGCEPEIIAQATAFSVEEIKSLI
ncbi:MAG: Rpn family recombination-promoting nuclease/putative transposase [Bacteroidales bacterium]|nr:Rpn family recombination-promoting nuclease/putative transposase [Bacteroidales bacterium]